MFQLTPAQAILIGSLVAVLGWLFNRWKDREHEIFKERIKRRIVMYEAVIEAVIPFANPRDGRPSGEPEEIDEKLSAANRLVQLYGYDVEIEAYSAFADALNQRNIPLLQGALPKLTEMIVTRMRKELGYGKRSVVTALRQT